MVCLWPSPIENRFSDGSGGPRGLLRLGYEFKGEIYHINYIAIEPVVDGKIEFSEISPSRVDGKWGKLMWASTNEEPGSFYPAAQTNGTISYPDPEDHRIEELSFYVFIEQFLNGAHPYLKLSIRSDRPQELGIQIFNFDDSATMDRCVVTATMGNYSRLRKLYLKDTIIDSRELYAGFNGIDFIEKEEYPSTMMV